MELIQQMKKRERIEMSLKLIASLLACFLAIILMEGMIYGILLNSIRNSTKSSYNSSTTIAYCQKEAEDKYFMIYYDTETKTWSAVKDSRRLTKEECLALKNGDVKDVVLRAPNAFELSIKPVHYAVMAILVAGVAGFFVYKFVKLNNSYAQIEKKFKETGEIEITNY